MGREDTGRQLPTWRGWRAPTCVQPNAEQLGAVYPRRGDAGTMPGLTQSIPPPPPSPAPTPTTLPTTPLLTLLHTYPLLPPSAHPHYHTLTLYPYAAPHALPPTTTNHCPLSLCQVRLFSFFVTVIVLDRAGIPCSFCSTFNTILWTRRRALFYLVCVNTYHTVCAGRLKLHGRDNLWPFTLVRAGHSPDHTTFLPSMVPLAWNCSYPAPLPRTPTYTFLLLWVNAHTALPYGRHFALPDSACHTFYASCIHIMILYGGAFWALAPWEGPAWCSLTGLPTAAACPILSSILPHKPTFPSCLLPFAGLSPVVLLD